MNRKQRRALEKQAEKNKTKEIPKKISSFGNLPDECMTCLAPFDKKDRTMVTTWSVVVRDDEDVRLYCPKCWDTAIKIVGEYYKENKNAST